MTEEDKVNYCLHCGKEAPKYHNYCTGNCHIEAAKAAGGEVITPNGLPIVCIRWDGSMLENEHADHPDYKFPVDVIYIGPNPKERFKLVDGEDNIYDLTEEEIENHCNQTHALIYCDTGLAVTLYESCYAMWYIHKNGEIGGGSLWELGEWRLTDESIEKCKQLTANRKMKCVL